MVETADVANVKYRAYELFVTHKGTRFSFTEVDGMIFTLTPLNARDALKHLRESEVERERWEYEYLINHEHVGFPDVDGTLRELIRQGNDLAEQLGQDLRAIYPDKSFVISHDYEGSIISLYQATEGAPKEALPAEDTNPEEAWCSHCGKRQPYVKRTEPDAEFPEADWGDCAVCGNEVLVARPRCSFSWDRRSEVRND